MIQDDVMNKETRNENVSCYGGQADNIPFLKWYDHDTSNEMLFQQRRGRGNLKSQK